MSGPTLGLNITGTGQAKIEATTSAVERLVAALRTLPAAAAEIDKLNKALNKAPNGPSGLKGGAADLKELVGEFKVLGAQLNTSFASLEETIKKGWARAQKANVEGEASVKSAKGAKQGLTFTSFGTTHPPLVTPEVQVDAGWFAKMQVGSLKIAEKQAADMDKADAILQAAFFKRYAKEDDWLHQLKLNSAKMAETQRLAGEKEARAAQARADRVAAAQDAADEKHRAAFFKQFELREEWLQKLKLQSAKMAEAYRVASEKEAAAIETAAAKLEARFAASSAASRNATILAARSQLDQGVAPSQVKSQYGAGALAAAEQTSFASAMQKVHGEVDRGVPKIEGYSRAMRDLHSSLRGVASGFGQMSLTWGAIGPLLAGAALSQSFVQSIKIGTSIRQDLEELRVLSEESQYAVDKLEKQLISLGQTGPYGPREVAEAMKTLSLAGLNAQQVSEALKPALDFAVTGGVGIQKASESLVAIGTAYGYQAGEFASVADAVSKAAAISMSSVSSMMDSFRASSVVAQSYGVSLKDAAASQALLANIGIRGSAAGTSMRQMYSELSGATNSTREAMKRLGVDTLDSSGKMKPLLDIFIQLSGALDKYNGKAQVAAVQALSNERGAKATVANLAAFRKNIGDEFDPEAAKVAPRGIRADLATVESEAKRMGQTATNELKRIRDLIDESAGFNAIAASQLAATPENLLKGVSASFQTALFEAFKELEPTLVLAAQQLRNVFNSEGFRNAITATVKLMGDFTAVLVDNIGWVEKLAYAFLAFKGLQTLELAISAGRVAWGLYTGQLALTTSGIMAANAATAATVPAMGAAATATRIFSLALASLGPVALAIGATALIWSVYAKNAKDAREVEAEANQQRQQLTLKSLEEEEKRLTAVALEMNKGLTQKEADLKIDKERAAVARELAYSQGRTVYTERVADLQREYDNARKRGVPESTINAKGGVGPALAYAQSELSWYDQAYKRNEAAVQAAQVRVQALTKGVDMMGAPKRQPGGPLEGEDWRKVDGALSAGQNSSELDMLRKQYTAAEQASQLAYRREMELLDIRYKGKLVSEAEYASQSEELSTGLYNRDLANLRRYVSEADSVIRALQADPKKASKAKGAIAEIESERQEKAAQLAFLQAKNAQEQAARANVQTAAMDEGLNKLRDSVLLQQQKYEADQRTLGMTPGMIAAEQAMTAARAQGAEAMKDTVRQLVLAQQTLNALEATAEPDPDTDTDAYVSRQSRIARLEAQLATLRAALNRGYQTTETEAGKAGTTAQSASDFAAQSWRKWVEEGKNSITVLTQSRNEFMTGWISAGQTMWSDFLRTGKVSWKALGDLAIKTLAEISYKKGVGQVFQEAGQSIFDRLIGPTADGKMGDKNSQTYELLKQKSAELGQSMDKLGNSFWNLLEQVGQGFAALFQSSGEGGFAGALSKMFGGSGSKAYVDNTGMDGSVDWTVPSAKGNVFNSLGLVHAFAKGGLPHNTVIDEPHYFRFGGGKLGVAGEAGSEAIMPLTRGPDGNLGVRATAAAAGAGAGPNITVSPRTSVVIEDHSGGAKPEVQQQRQPDGSELIRVVIGAAAKDISRGGDLRKSVQNVQGRGNLPRY